MRPRPSIIISNRGWLMWLMLSQLTFNLTAAQREQTERKKYDITPFSKIAQVGLPSHRRDRYMMGHKTETKILLLALIWNHEPIIALQNQNQVSTFQERQSVSVRCTVHIDFLFPRRCDGKMWFKIEARKYNTVLYCTGYVQISSETVDCELLKEA